MAVINFINQSAQKEPVNIIAFSAMEGNMPNLLRVVWKTCSGVKQGDQLEIGFPGWGYLEVVYAGGHRSDRVQCNEGQRFRIIQDDGVTIALDGEAATMNQVEIVNLLDEAVDIIYYKGNTSQEASAFLMIKNLGTNELAELNIPAKLCFAVAPEINTGAVIREHTPLQALATIDLTGKEQTVMLSGGGKDPFSFGQPKRNR